MKAHIILHQEIILLHLPQSVDTDCVVVCVVGCLSSDDNQ